MELYSLRSLQLLSYLRISQYFLEPESSLPCSQDPSTGAYPEPDLSHQLNKLIRFQVFTAVTTKETVFWDVTPCSLLVLPIYQKNALLVSPKYQSSCLKLKEDGKYLPDSTASYPTIIRHFQGQKERKLRKKSHRFASSSCSPSLLSYDKVTLDYPRLSEN
jgi:hypothetical protein